MTFRTLTFDDWGTTVQTSRFAPGHGIAEWHLIFHVEARGDCFEAQQERLESTRQSIMEMPEFCGANCIMSRYFLSDISNQHHLLRTNHAEAASIIQQPPLDGSKIALWMYLQGAEASVHRTDSLVTVEHNGYSHLWAMGLTAPQGDSAAQTDAILQKYGKTLGHQQMALAQNCLRTWFFVRDVDTQYAGLVRARREHFQQNGLSPQTHYIASTGIGGNPCETSAIVQMDAYALKGHLPQQVRHLKALTHLNPTYEYGVTFERGTMVDYGDRRHIFISGTASIDNKGNVLYVGDIMRQTSRMWENVEALLQEAGANFSDVMQMVVYLRDIADYSVVNAMFRTRFPDIPLAITLAPVCRPTWLIEMECMAVVERTDKTYRNF